MSVVSKWLLVSLGTVVGCIALAALAITLDGLHDHVVNADLAIVPANPVCQNGQPSRRLAGRLDAALQLYRQGHCKLILVSGTARAKGPDEADVMKTYLVERGVPAEDVITDHVGVNTLATARAAAQLIRERGLGEPLVASQFFHISRLRLALAKEGVTMAGHVHSLRFERRDLFSVAREIAAYAFYLVR